MKNFNRLSILALIALVAFTGCSKDDGPIPKDIGIENVPVVSTNLATGGTAATITFASQSTFQGNFKVTMYFPTATPPTKVDIVVRKITTAPATTTIKQYKTDVATLPASFTVTAADIATLFGTTSLALNDTYDFAPDIYVGTKKYEAFPATGVGSGQGVTGMSAIGFGEYVRYSVK